MTARTVYLNALTMIAPGIETEDELRTALIDAEMIGFPADWKASPDSIASRARRRYSPQTLLAIQVAENIVPSLSEDAAWVFGSTFGEGETLKIILDALCTPNMAIRPTRFQNSVHNAASGQWTIARSIRNAATSICGGDYTSGSSLLKAFIQVQLEDRSVGIVLFDTPLPYPLSQSHRLKIPAGVGLALTPNKSALSIAAIEYSLSNTEGSQGISILAEKAQPIDNPILAMVPLIERVFGLRDDDIAIGLNGTQALNLKVQML